MGLMAEKHCGQAKAGGGGYTKPCWSPWLMRIIVVPSAGA